MDADSLKGRIMKATIAVLIVAMIIFFVAGCGPGEPFEIEGLRAPQSASVTQVAAAK